MKDFNFVVLSQMIPFLLFYVYLTKASVANPVLL